MHELFVAVGLLLAIEGTLYAAFPSAMKGVIRWVLDLPDATLRSVGVGSLALGVVVVWMARFF